MSAQPWLTDPMYGGMSETAARRSYEAWERQGRKPLAAAPSEPVNIADRELIERQIEAQLADLESGIDAFEQWMKAWRDRQPKGFRALRRKPVSRETAAAAE